MSGTPSNLNAFRPPFLAPSQWRLALSNRRGRTLFFIGVCLLFMIVIITSPLWLNDSGLDTHLEDRNISPSLAHPFGTDWLGREMLTRTLYGLSLSLRTGLLAASIAAVVGLGLGLLAGIFGGKVDLAITWLVDVLMGLPHLILLILISFAMGGGMHGVIIAVAATHWPSLTRIIRAETLSIKNKDYIHLSSRLGHSRWYIARYHILPHLIPQFLVGLILLFPHAILHEAGLTFVGIGLSAHTPAIGIILSEAMRHISTGYWWLAVIPGLALLMAVMVFDALGENVRAILNPKTSQE